MVRNKSGFPMNMSHIATTEEIIEINIALQTVVQYVPSFVMMGQQYFRITAPLGHPHYHSDMTMEGLKEWRIIA